MVKIEQGCKYCWSVEATANAGREKEGNQMKGIEPQTKNEKTRKKNTKIAAGHYTYNLILFP